MAVDSKMMFYDVTHGKEMVSLSGEREVMVAEGEETMEEEETKLITDYETLYSRYLERQFRHDHATLEKASSIFSLTPSISQSFSYLSSQLML